jgi:uncharacterized protein DUF6537
MAGVLSSLRYLLADLIGDDEEARPSLPDGLSGNAAPMVSEAIDRLVEYQGPSYAKLYVDRLRRFIGRRDVDDAVLCEIARLMALRMSYEDPIRIAQLKLAEAADGNPRPASTDEIAKFRFDELVGALPAKVAAPVLDVLEWLRWTHRPVRMRFSARTRLGVRRLQIEAALRRWRLFSVRYAVERVWVERWLHMIDRSLTKQPAATLEIVRTANMINGYGDRYRHGVADWHAIIDGLVKPVFDGALFLPNLAGAVAEARAAAMPDPRQAALKRKIAEIRAGAVNAAA